MLFIRQPRKVASVDVVNSSKSSLAHIITSATQRRWGGSRNHVSVCAKYTVVVVVSVMTIDG